LNFCGTSAVGMVDAEAPPASPNVRPAAPSAGTAALVTRFRFEASFSRGIVLLPYKDGDANVRSVWLCSRNDAIGNVIVMFAALGVWVTATAWPDLAVAAVMAAIFLTSSIQILRQAWAEYRIELHQPEPKAS
jgi:hypothetical protein